MTVATATELWRMSATELAEAIRTRQASSVEVVQAHLRRIDAVNPSINAVVMVLGDQALVSRVISSFTSMASRATMSHVPFRWAAAGFG